MSEFNKISLDMWESVLKKALSNVQYETLTYNVCSMELTSQGLILEGLIKEFRDGNRSRTLYENLCKYSS